MRLYDRVCRVVAYRQSAGSYRPSFVDGLEISRLRIAFEISKSIGKEPNTATVTITNASTETRAELQRQPLLVRLEAGYDGVYRSLFVGDVRYADTKTEGPDRHTTLELRDGGRAYGGARLQRAYRAGTPTATILRELAAELGADLPSELLRDAALTSSIAASETVAGMARDELTRILARHGYSWSLQSGRLQVLPFGAALDGTAWPLSAETGLVGSPEYSEPDKKSKRRTLTAKALLYPELAPGAKVLVQSAEIDGLHRVTSVRHSGDTAGTDWYTEIEATPL